MKVLLTLDYELFNGAVGGTIQNCLIEPINHLIPILEKHNAKITLFVDACFLLRLEELKSSNNELECDWQHIVDHLRRLSQNGHDIQLHLHPQWINAEYINGIWYSELKDYKLSDLPVHVARTLFSRGCDIIHRITGKRPIAFRAGDYCAQTYTDLFDVMKENNLIIDSSVFRKKKVINQREWFDYTNIPASLKYNFSRNIIMEDPNGCFTEVSIPTFSHSKLSLLLKKKSLNKLGLSNKPWGDGTSSTGGTLEKGIKKVIAKMKLYLKPTRFAMSLDGISCAYLKDNYNDAKKEGKEYVMIMGHPKTFSPLSLHLYDEFLSYIDSTDKCEPISSIIK